MPLLRISFIDAGLIQDIHNPTVIHNTISSIRSVQINTSIVAKYNVVNVRYRNFNDNSLIAICFTFIRKEIRKSNVLHIKDNIVTNING